MANTTPEQVLKALRQVFDPDLGKDIVSAGMVKDVRIEEGEVSFTIELTTPACPLRSEFEQQARRVVQALRGVTEVRVNMSSSTAAHRPQEKRLPDGVKNVIAVGSGKGGVGKSTVAVNLAVALAKSGAEVGLLDSDVYGPDVPKMMGLHGRPRVEDKKLVPMESCGVRVMSLGFLVEEETPVIWRGPLVGSIIKQFLEDVRWGQLDYLVVDLPPGTGDAQLSLVQLVPVTGVVVVTTPQDVALHDAVKALRMFEKVNVPVLGIVENMSYFVCPHCGQRSEIFSHGGARQAAQRLGVAFLGEVPLDGAIREGGDLGTPSAAEDNSPLSSAFGKIAGAVASQVSILNLAGG